MNEELNQNLSQFLDDELEHKVALDLLQKMQTNPALKSTLARYATISHALKTDEFLPVPPRFSEQVAQQIEQEAIYLLPRRKPAGQHYIRLALAASVAVVAVLAARGVNTPETSATLATASLQAIQQTPAKPDDQPIASAALPEEDPYPLNARISDYLEAHNNSIYSGEVDVDFRPLTKVTSYNQK